MSQRKPNEFVSIALIVLCIMLLASCEPRPRRGEALLRERIAALGNARNADAHAREQAYFRDSIHMDSLRNSPLWNDYIDAWVASFAREDSLVPASEKLLRRVADRHPEAFKPLVRDICRALKNRGEHNVALKVACLPYGIDAARNPQIAARLLVSTLLTGQPAPPLSTNEGTIMCPGRNGQQTILFFYESRCRTCQAMMQQLIDEYDELQTRGVRVITLSSDTDKNLFAGYSRRFPWRDKLCDFRGFNSPAFASYGVAAAPATFLINEKGVVVEQFESVEELLDVFKPEI